MGGTDKNAKDSSASKPQDSEPSVLDSVTAGIERLEKAAYDAAPPMEDVKTFAREYGLVGARYGLMAALAVASPKEAIKRALGYVEGVEAERQAGKDEREEPDPREMAETLRDLDEATKDAPGRDEA